MRLERNEGVEAQAVDKVDKGSAQVGLTKIRRQVALRRASAEKDKEIAGR